MSSKSRLRPGLALVGLLTGAAPAAAGAYDFNDLTVLATKPAFVVGQKDNPSATTLDELVISPRVSADLIPDGRTQANFSEKKKNDVCVTLRGGGVGTFRDYDGPADQPVRYTQTGVLPPDQLDQLAAALRADQASGKQVGEPASVAVADALRNLAGDTDNCAPGKPVAAVRPPSPKTRFG